MRTIPIDELNSKISSGSEFVEECELEYSEKINAAAMAVCDNIKNSPIVLLSGPSGSGKTTTALKINEKLTELGIVSHVVSLDNYFNTVDVKTAPRTEEGELDYESPLCLDMELLNEHFTALANGEEIRIPYFMFARQKRSASMFTPLKLGKNEIAIFEGIHALNDEIAGKHPEAFKLYISASTRIAMNDGGFFDCTWIRLLRRMVRDNNFRGSDAIFTLNTWPNVMRGERLYIDPFKYKSNLMFDTALPYELAVLKDEAFPLIKDISDIFPELSSMKKYLPEIASMDSSLVPEDSMLREFIGGSIYQY